LVDDKVRTAHDVGASALFLATFPIKHDRPLNGRLRDGAANCPKYRRLRLSVFSILSSDALQGINRQRIERLPLVFFGYAQTVPAPPQVPQLL
jgi:hypothetical protein